MIAIVGSLLRSIGQQGAGEAPAAPVLSAADAGDGSTITATVSGADGATHLLLYRAAGSLEWLDGNSRVGDGQISQGSLTAGVTYQLVAASRLGGLYSLPSDPVEVTVSGSDEWTMARRIVESLGEAVTYVKADGTERQIKAVVAREPNAPVAAGAGVKVTTYQFTVSVEQHASRGILPSEIDTGGDRIKLPLRSGNTPDERAVVLVMSQGNAALELMDLAVR